MSVPSWLDHLLEHARDYQVDPRLRPPAAGGCRSAAVLVLFGAGADGPDVLLTRRADTLNHHAGQVAFPGGSVDPQDAGPAATALREAAEETGLDPTGVVILTTLPDVYVSRSGFQVTPVIAWWERPSAVAPVDAAEVAVVTRVSIAELTDPRNRMMLGVGAARLGPAFEAANLLVWGFTAALLDSILTLGGWSRPWDATATRPLPPEVLHAINRDPAHAGPHPHTVE